MRQLDFDTEIENLKSQQIAAYYEEQFDRIIDKINQTKERLSTINGLISDDMKINKNTRTTYRYGRYVCYDDQSGV